MPSTSAPAGHGLVFDSSLLHSLAFTVLNNFVLINTVMFLALAILKLMPKVYINDWITSANRRAETRGIHPDLPDAAQPTTGAHPVIPATIRSTPSPTLANRHRVLLGTQGSQQAPRRTVAGHAAGSFVNDDKSVVH